MSSATALSAFTPRSLSATVPRAYFSGREQAEPTQLSLLNRIVVQAPARNWRQQVEEKLQKLIRLPVGWDGYGAVPVSFETANFAVRMLESICPTDAPVPYLVPGTVGDIQIEWHTDAVDIELHVRRPNSVHAWRESAASGRADEEMELTFDFRPILSWVKQLSEAGVDDSTAAA